MLDLDVNRPPTAAVAGVQEVLVEAVIRRVTASVGVVVTVVVVADVTVVEGSAVVGGGRARAGDVAWVGKANRAGVAVG